MTDLFGVIAGLSTVEQMTKNKRMEGTVKVAIYACEESSRFGNACLGSKFLNGNLERENFDSILDQKELKNGNTVSLTEAIDYAKGYLRENTEGVEEVERILDKDEADYSLEAHIEQYEILHKQTKKQGKGVLGIVTSVGSAVRVKYDVTRKSRTYRIYSYEKERKCS